ncbi:Kynurenine 3-monooxygenase, partial [Tetrabaena socialis]
QRGPTRSSVTASTIATPTSSGSISSGGSGGTGTPSPTPTVSPADPATWAPLNGQTAVVVGAGPAGCTLAMYLARAGWFVQVYERRPEPGPVGVSRQRSWVLAMYPRGIRPVRAVAEVPLLAERAYKGLVIKPAKPGAKPTVLERSGVLMDRTLLATSLLGAARSQYGARVAFTFNASLQDVDFGRKTAVFTAGTAAAAAAAGAADAVGSGGSAASQQVEAAAATAAQVVAPPSGATAAATMMREAAPAGGGGSEVVAEVQYDMLVGADGSSSTVRSLLAAAFPGEYDTEVLSPGTGCYKAMSGLPPLPEVDAWEPDAASPPELRPRGAFFFVLTGGTKGMMSICRDIDGCYCGYMASTAEAFAQLKTREVRPRPDALWEEPANRPGSPPMYELLRGHMGYREMLARVYGMAAIGTACTAGLLYGIGRMVAAALAVVGL